MSERNCNGCTACCEGYLSATIHGHPMFRGKPCHFVKIDNGCGIYDDRPKDICATFKCAWLNDQNNFYPEWIKPNLSGIIIKEERWGPQNSLKYLDVIEYRKKIEPEVLNWLIMFSDQHKMPLRYEVNFLQFTRGPEEFINYIETKSKNK